MSSIPLDIIRGKVIFDYEIRGYRFVATGLIAPKGDALIEISKTGVAVREFFWPSYKVWNIAAHADDIVDGLEQHCDDGLYVAGATGFGGNVYTGPAAQQMTPKGAPGEGQG